MIYVKKRIPIDVTTAPERWRTISSIFEQFPSKSAGAIQSHWNPHTETLELGFNCSLSFFSGDRCWWVNFGGIGLSLQSGFIAHCVLKSMVVSLCIQIHGSCALHSSHPTRRWMGWVFFASIPYSLIKERTFVIVFRFSFLFSTGLVRLLIDLLHLNWTHLYHDA